MGWPRDSRPPDGLTGMRPPRVVSPRSLHSPPSPKPQKPRFSIWMISPMAVASCTSATETSRGPRPAISQARRAARAVQCCAASSGSRSLPVCSTEASTRTARWRPWRRRASARSLHTMAAAAPSDTGEHISMVSG